jgi:uncharacterized membrane protein
MKKIFVCLLLFFLFQVPSYTKQSIEKSTCSKILQAEKEGRVALIRLNEIYFVVIWYSKDKKIIKKLIFQYNDNEDSDPNILQTKAPIF